MDSSLNSKYRIALAIVAVLVLADQALVQPYMIRLLTDAPRINVAGRQRMLSQRLAKAALGSDGGDGEQAREYLDEMRRMIGPWTGAHEWLLRDSPWPGRASQAVREGLAGLEPSFSRLRDAALRLVRAGEARPPDVAAMNEARAVILDNEAEYLARMERAVGLFELEARGSVETLRWVGWTVTGLTIATLAAIGRFILAPAVRLIRRQFDELTRARDELEARIVERTRELESARERHEALLEQFSHAGRASTIGEMASSLAHELNQPLGAIANYAEGCLIELASPEPALGDIRTALERLRAATMRAGRIIEQVRRFVTRQGPTREPFQANRVVEEVAEILGVEARRRGVSVALELAPGLPSLHGDPIQVQQVLVNLARNAFEAMSQAQASGPTLVIRTGPSGGGGVEFAVTDNGEGIPREQVGRIFDAYYSTRAGGMGMGLAICRTIAEAHQGRLTVESDPGVRTTFRFSIPVESHDPT
jgi:signal transduction histidine kinase